MELEKVAGLWKERRELIYLKSVKAGVVSGFVGVVPFTLWIEPLIFQPNRFEPVGFICLALMIGLAVFLMSSFWLTLTTQNPIKGLCHRDQVKVLELANVITHSTANLLK